MPAKPVFSPDQHEEIVAAAVRVWQTKFKAQKKTQEEMALALGITQQSVSNLVRGTYHPGVRVARAIANLDGKTLEQLIGDYAQPEVSPMQLAEPVTQGHGPVSASQQFPNLTTCLQFHASSKHWSPWTIAAARAGFFGNADFAPPEWAGKLDHLEKALEKARRGM
jgi:transcriptional regulator with XRE-family HTH domain